jgi:hypothetical protein
MNLCPRLAHTGLAIALAALFFAGKAAEASGRVTIQLTQIRASGRGGPKQIEPSLEHLRSQLENYPYSKFEPIGVESQTVSDGQTATFHVTGGYKLRAEPSEGGGGAIVLDVKIRDGRGAEKLATRLKLPNGGTVLIAKDFEVGDGRLVLALTVQRGR